MSCDVLTISSLFSVRIYKAARFYAFRKRDSECRSERDTRAGVGNLSLAAGQN